MNIRAPHSLSIDDLIAGLGSDKESGLSDAEASARLASVGRNALPEPPKPSIVLLFLRQFHGALTYILLAAAAISVVTGEAHDAYGIGLALLLNACIGFVQERRAESAIERLKRMVMQEAVVIREGHAHRVDATTVVPGDLLVLEEGARVAADARLVLARELRTDESALTGESSPASKEPGLAAENAPLPEMAGMVWMGTAVTSGSGLAVVVRTGGETAFGRIAASLGAIKRGRTPLETRLDRLGRQLGVAAIALAAVTLVAGILRGFPPAEMFFFAVAMLVAVVPEGLPAVLAVVLAIGVIRMARRNAIVRHVPSVETLGAADVICTDKTGTLTENKMTVREVVLAGETVTVGGEGWEPVGTFTIGGTAVRPAELAELESLLRSAALVSRATLEIRADERHDIVGDATDGALTVVAAKAGIEKPALAESCVTIDEIPFTSVRKYHAVLAECVDVRGRKTRDLHVAGAYGVLRDRVTHVFDGERELPFDATASERFNEASRAMGERSLRVIAIAVRRGGGSDPSALAEGDVSGLTLLGLVGMIDPPRAGVKGALDRCRNAGIRVIMLTGDQRATAEAIGREIGLVDGADGRGVYTEREVAAMDDAALLSALGDARIFARVSPETKLRIVAGLQKLGKTVAMTGDGVNDAPALKKSAIGVAMGITGTDVTKEVADMVLTDDNFVSIVNAVEEGRIVFRNVRQSTAFLFMTNVGEAITLLTAILAGLPLPLLPAQILWMNLITDSLPGIALATEPANGDILSGPPRRRDEPVLTRKIVALSALTAAVMCAGTLGLFVWSLSHGGLDHARTMAFTTMAAFQFWNVFNLRSVDESVFRIGFFDNRYAIGAVALSTAMQALVLYVPGLQGFFGTVPLGLKDVAIVTMVSSSIFAVVEAWKAAYRWSSRRAIRVA